MIMLRLLLALTRDILHSQEHMELEKRYRELTDLLVIHCKIHLLLVMFDYFIL